MFDVITIGSATLDVFVRSKGLEIERENGAKDICVRYGAKIPVDELYFESGGGGTNTAITFARQDLKTATIVKVADDFSGKKVIEDLRKEGVETSFIVIEKGGMTDYSTVLWAPDGGRTILVYRGKTRVEVNEIPWRKLETKWFYITSVEGNLEVIENCKFPPAGRAGKIENCRVAWNPGGAELAQREKLLSLLEGITLLNLNKEEMMQLLGSEGEKWEVGQLLEKAAGLPCEYVVITDDRNGSYLHQKGQDFWWHCGVYQDVPKYESTGAGDAFGSGLVCGLIKGFDMEKCLKLATANASSVVSRVGAKKGILKAEEVENWLNKEILIDRIKI